MRVIFMGTPEFAVPSLEAVAREHEVVLVVAQPDKPAGRGMKLQAPAVAVRARELGLPLLQPAKVRNADFLDAVRDARPDAGVVVAYGKILPNALLDIPVHGFFNVHGSVLPRWRGAAPIQRAIEAGDCETGVTIMRVDEELDHGPILAIETTPIGADERTPELARRLSRIGAEALARALRDVERGAAVETEQDHARATVAKKIEKSEGEITFTESAKAIYDRFRAFEPWPGVFVQSGGEILKLTNIRPASGGQALLPVPASDEGTGKSACPPPREVLALDDDGVVIAAGEQAIRILEMQRAGKPRSAAAAIARGLGWRVGRAV